MHGLTLESCQFPTGALFLFFSSPNTWMLSGPMHFCILLSGGNSHFILQRSPAPGSSPSVLLELERSCLNTGESLGWVLVGDFAKCKKNERSIGFLLAIPVSSRIRAHWIHCSALLLCFLLCCLLLCLPLQSLLEEDTGEAWRRADLRNENCAWKRLLCQLFSFSLGLWLFPKSQNNLQNEELEHEWINEGISETDSSASRWAWLDKWEISTALKHAREVGTTQVCNKTEQVQNNEVPFLQLSLFFLARRAHLV